jgi:ferritin-like protein
VLAAPWVGAARAATDDDLAFAYFGLSAELLLADFYGKAIAAGTIDDEYANTLKRSRTYAKQHATSLTDLLKGAGTDAPTAEDFEFQWPKSVFADSAKTLDAGLTILAATQGAYQTAAASSTEPTYRVLFASLASASAQVGLLRAIARRPEPEPFPVALDLEAASNAIESYLG